MNFGTNGINGNLSGELSSANVLTYSAGQNMTGNLSFNDNLQNDLAKSKSLRAGEEEYQRKLAEFMQLKENSIRDYYLNQLNNPELYQEYLNADPEKQDQMLKAMEIDKYGKNSKSNANFFTRALSDAGGYFSSIAGLGYSDADSFTDSEGEFHQRTCFVKGTLVTVEQNTSGAFEKGGTWFKKIEEIKAGDRVLSKNEITGELEYKTVTKLFLHEVELLFKLRIIGGAIIETTWNHPFMIKGRGWVQVKDLRIGDEAILHDGRLTQIQSIEQVKVSSTKVYNLEVEDFHTYFVGEDGVWVHNYLGQNGNAPSLVNTPADAGIFSTFTDWLTTTVFGNKPNDFNEFLSMLSSGSENTRNAAIEWLQNNKLSAVENAELALYTNNAGIVKLTPSQVQEQMNVLYEASKEMYNDQKKNGAPFELTPYERESLRPYFGTAVDDVSFSTGGIINTIGSWIKPGAPAFTIGNTIYLTSGDTSSTNFETRLGLVAHEMFHTSQFNESNIISMAFRGSSDESTAREILGDSYNNYSVYDGTLSPVVGDAFNHLTPYQYLAMANDTHFQNQPIYLEQLARAFRRSVEKDLENKNSFQNGKKK